MTLKEHREQLKTSKRRAALDAGVAAFLRNGYDRTTLAQIAKEAGISTGTLFKHFPTKDAIWLAAMQWVSERLLSSLEAAAGKSDSPMAQGKPVAVQLANRLLVHE